MPAPAVLGLLGRLVAGSAIRAEGAELAAGGLGRAAAGAAGKSLIKKKLLDAVTPDNDEASNDNTRNDPKAVAQASPSYGQVTSIPQFGASAAPIASNDNTPMTAAGSSMFDSAQAISLLTTSVALLRNIVEGIEQQAMAARDAARAMRENQLENANEKTDINTSEAQSGVAGEGGLGTGLAALGIGAAGVWGLKQLDTLATKSADQLTDYFSDHLSKFLGSFIEDLPKTMMKFMMGTITGGPVKGALDAMRGGGEQRHAPGIAPDNSAVPAAKGDRARHMKVLYDSFRKQGLTHEGSVTMLAQIGRENAYNPKHLFGTHYDPHNKKLNAGLISWQGDRATKLLAYMKRRGQLDDDGKIKRTDEALAVQAEFMVQEMKNNKQYSQSYKAVTDPNKKYSEIEGTVGDNYIAWRRNDPRYREGGYRNQNFFLKQAREVVAKDQAQAYTKPTPELMKRPEAQKAAPGSLLLKPGAKPLDVNPWAGKPVARSSFVSEQPAFGSMFGELGVNPVEGARANVERQVDPSGLLDRILGSGSFSGARIQAPKLGQLDNVMMSVLRDIVENKRQTTEAPASQPSINMPIIAQGGQQQAAPAMSLTVPSPGKALSSMSWDMYFDTQRGL